MVEAQDLDGTVTDRPRSGGRISISMVAKLVMKKMKKAVGKRE